MKGIFSNETNAHKQLAALRSSDQAVAMAVFEDLAVALARKSVSVVGIVSLSRERSMAASAATNAREPCLSLFLTGGSYRESGVDPHDSNWSGDWAHTAFVREHWGLLCSQHHVPKQHHSNEMFVFVYDAQHLDLVRLVAACKTMIREIMSATFDASRVFASSEPSLSVVLPTREALERARVAGDLTRARDFILTVLERNDRYDCFSQTRVGIHFLDAETSAAELYHLARED
jgi:hypothetical protein